jgi:hypothetical protein
VDFFTALNTFHSSPAQYKISCVCNVYNRKYAPLGRGVGMNLCHFRKIREREQKKKEKLKK